VLRREFLLENFLVKYCNFIVNWDHSSLGHIFDYRFYVRVFCSILFTRELYCLVYYSNIIIIDREETVKEIIGCSGFVAGSIFFILLDKIKGRIGYFSWT